MNEHFKAFYRDVVVPTLERACMSTQARVMNALFDALGKEIAEGTALTRDIRVGTLIASGGLTQFTQNSGNVEEEGNVDVGKFTDGMLAVTMQMAASSNCKSLRSLRHQSQQTKADKVRERILTATEFLANHGVRHKKLKAFRVLSDTVLQRELKLHPFPQPLLALLDRQVLRSNIAMVQQLLEGPDMPTTGPHVGHYTMIIGFWRSASAYLSNRNDFALSLAPFS